VSTTRGVDRDPGEALSDKTTKPNKMGERYEQRVTFWGVRGTLPTPGAETLHYGGNTSCVEVLNIDHATQKQTAIVLDAGTGLANFGEAALKRGDRRFHILLSHMHYDHIMGFLRFKPIFRSDCEIVIYGQAKSGMTLSDIFKKFFDAPFFPLQFDQLGARRNTSFVEINGKESIIIDGAEVQLQTLNHPQDAIASRVWSFDKSSSVVYATDHEHGTGKDDELVAFAQGASLFLYDSTYPDEGFERFAGWGHSTPTAGAEIAKKAGVAAYGLFHHDPESSDADLESCLLPEAKKIFRQSFLTVENQTIRMSDLLSTAPREKRTRVG
jgi:phosphoribosyl 1,2-cyclic phosphodiesterase